MSIDVKKLYTAVFLLFVTASGLQHASAQPTPAFQFSEGLIADRSNEKTKTRKYGFVNEKGRMVIPYHYDTVYTAFKNGFAGVGRNRKAGVIDKKGKTVVPFEYREVGETLKNIIPVKSENGLWCFFNEAGEKFYEPVFQNYRYGGKNKILVQKDGKWGMISHKGESLVDFNYKWIQHLSEKKYKVTYVNEWTVRDATNKVIFKSSFDSLRYIGDGLYKYYIIGKYGILDGKGNRMTSPEYDDIRDFRNGMVAVRKDRYGVVDKNNRQIIPFQFDDVILDSLYIRVMVKELSGSEGPREKWGLYDYKGNRLIAPKYAMMNAWSDGLIAAKKEDGSWGYIDAKGNTEVIFRYAYAEDFKEGIARVQVPYYLSRLTPFAIIDKSGEYVISPADYDYYVSGVVKINPSNRSFYIVPKTSYSTYEKVGDNLIRVTKGGKYGMITTYGIQVIPPVYDYVSEPGWKGLIVVEKEGKSGVVDANGRVVFRLSNKFEKLYGFRSGFSRFLLKGKYGFTNQIGDVYISPQYPEAGEMSDSMVNVKLRGKWGFLDYKENLKVQPYYQEVQPFKNGVALVSEHGRWNIVNKEGKELHMVSFDTIVGTPHGHYLLQSGDKVGLADKRGREILAPKYEQILESGNGYVMVKKGGYWGVLDYKENFVLPIESDVVIYEPDGNVFITGQLGKQEEILVK